MSTQPKKNLVKKFVSIAGVASASVVFSLPAFALTRTDATTSYQVNNQAYPTSSSVSNRNLLAQNSGAEPSNSNMDVNSPTSLPTNTDRDGINQSPSMPTMDGSGSTTQPSSTGESNINQRSTTGGINNTLPSSTTNDMNRSNQMYSETQGETNKMRRLVTGGDSVRGVIFQCLNNPNPSCGS